MAAPAERLEPVRFAARPGGPSAESRAWRKYRNNVIIKEFGAVSNVGFSPLAPYDLATSSSARIQIYSSITRGMQRSITRFKDVATCFDIRRDGKLLVAGDSTGLVQIFDLSSRSILRTMHEHRLPVRVVRFSAIEPARVLTGGDDKTVVLWDVPTGERIRVLSGHTDYVRDAVFHPRDSNVVVTGSYDGTVRVWDLSAPSGSGQVLRFKHGSPVEKVFVFPSGTVCVSLGGNKMKVWNLASGQSRPVRTVVSPAKEFTCIAANSNCSRILCGGLDGHVRIYNVETWKVVHIVRFPGPILSVALSPDENHFAIGMANGLLSIRSRPSHRDTGRALAAKQTALLRTAKPSTFRRAMRGMEYKGDADEYYVEEDRRRKRLKPFEKALLRFNYGDAMDLALRMGDPITFVTIIHELQHREGLRQALANRDDVSLDPIIRLLTKHLCHPLYSRAMADCLLVLLDIYGPALASSALVESSVERLHTKIEREIVTSQDASRLVGMLEILAL